MPVPTTAPEMNSVTVEPGSAGPVRRGLVTFVTPSPATPESSAAISPGAAGAAGAVVSIVTEHGELVVLVLPAASVAVAVTT